MAPHRSLAAAALGFALLSPCAHGGGPERIYVGVTLKEAYFDNRAPPEQRMEYLVIYPDGLALRELPSGGLDYDNVEKLAQKRNTRVGSYTRTPETMHIEWGTGRKRQTWELESSGSGWTRGSNTTFEPAERVNAQTLKGIWQKVSSTQHSSSTSAIGIGGNEVIFRSKGEFEQGKKHGRFELDGYTLILHDSDGETRRYAIYQWPWAPGTIAIGTNLYQLLQSRR